MGKKDIIETAIGFICWAFAVALALLTSLGIIDIHAVLNFVYCAIVVLCIVLIFLLLLWLYVKK